MKSLLPLLALLMAAPVHAADYFDVSCTETYGSDAKPLMTVDDPMTVIQARIAKDASYVQITTGNEKLEATQELTHNEALEGANYAKKPVAHSEGSLLFGNEDLSLWVDVRGFIPKRAKMDRWVTFRADTPTTSMHFLCNGADIFSE